MHEMSIAMKLVDHLLEVARQHDAQRVEQVEVEIGILQQVLPEALEMAFSAATMGTIAQDAVLKLSEVPALVECRSCKQRFEPEINDYLCPRCRRADARIVAGNDIVLKSIVCQTEESAIEP